MRKLYISGVIKTDPFCILHEQERFYRSALNISSFLTDLNIPILKSKNALVKAKFHQRNVLIFLTAFTAIKHQEMMVFLSNSTNNSGPAVISDSFISCVNECFEKGEMSSSQKQAVITRIEKKGNDRSLLENWRPISLVNADTKIMTKVIAWRIKNVLPDIIHHNQTGYVKSSNNDPDIALNMSSFLIDLNIPILKTKNALVQAKFHQRNVLIFLTAFTTIKHQEMMAFLSNSTNNSGPAVISNSFISCVNECFEKGEMSSSQKQAVITRIEKKGSDRSLLENWRPISLVNADTKIMTKVIAWRKENVLPDIIHHNQTGYVKDRFIGETMRSIYDIMDFTVKENIPGLMVFIDFQKAFDSVDYGNLFSNVLKFLILVQISFAGLKSSTKIYKAV